MTAPTLAAAFLLLALGSGSPRGSLARRSHGGPQHLLANGEERLIGWHGLTSCNRPPLFSST